ncbi:hypothetical protein EG856_00970 [Mycoplasmopsis phocirhinis]|uniref:Cell division protein FtsZ n=1 Tax=Mycoplasmopsis phocirhinis TaxID=142650 RepID=A0A4P6MNM9_9BACT|nr:hypothetical protein [Mycoplasmopsis phocirhinis]QBF34500.1 hypothetical protein EG856_00970 [Mycoplasmopsis phocirhinis]
MSINANQIKIKVIGLGIEAKNIINLLHFQNQNIEIFEAQSDIKNFSNNEKFNQILFEYNHNLLGLDSIEQDSQQNQNNITKINNVINDADFIVLIAGANGQIDNKFIPQIAQCAKKINIPTLAIVSMPCEDIYGKIERQKALIALQNIKSAVNSYMVIDYNDLSESLDLPMTSLIELPGIIANNSLNTLFDLFYENMQTNIDFLSIKNMFMYGGQILISSGWANQQDIITNALADEEQRAKFIAKSNNFSKMILHIKSISITGKQLLSIRKNIIQRYNLNEDVLDFKTAFQSGNNIKHNSINISYILSENNLNLEQNNQINSQINHLNSKNQISTNSENNFDITSEILLNNDDVIEEDKEEKNTPQIPIFY